MSPRRLPGVLRAALSGDRRDGQYPPARRDHAPADRPRSARPRDRARRAGARADEPQPARRRRGRPRRRARWGRAGTPPTARRTPRCAALAACGDADLPGRRCTSRSSRAATRASTPPCTDAILAAGIGRVVVASDDPTEKASGRGLGHPARRGRRGRRRRRRARRARPLPQPGLPQARADRPAAGALQVGDDARRQGRHPHRRLEVDLGRGLALPRPPLARRARRRRGRDRHRAGRRPAADRAHRGRRPPAARASCSTPRRGCRWTPSSCAARTRCR